MPTLNDLMQWIDPSHWDFMLMDPRTLQVTAPHVAIITKLAPHPVFASEDAAGRVPQAIELLEVRPSVHLTHYCTGCICGAMPFRM